MKTSHILLPIAGLASAGFLAVMYRAYRRDIRSAQARVSTGSSVLNTKRGAIEYALIGEGFPLLVVHGAGGGFDQAQDFAGAFFEGDEITPEKRPWLRGSIWSYSSCDLQGVIGELPERALWSERRPESRKSPPPFARPFPTGNQPRTPAVLQPVSFALYR